jgi:hypothetical protein
MFPYVENVLNYLLTGLVKENSDHIRLDTNISHFNLKLHDFEVNDVL